MNNLRFYKVIIILLVILNLGTLTFLWFGPPKERQAAERGQSARFLIRELRLNPRQRIEFGKLRDAHRFHLSALQEQDRKLHDRFFETLFLPIPDSIRVKLLADSIADNRKKMEMLTFEHFMQLRQLLTDKQKVKFQRVFRKALERAMPLPAPGDPPGPPPPHQPAGR